VYGVYAFSQEVLRIDPQAYWVDKKPLKLSPATILGLDDFAYDSGMFCDSTFFFSPTFFFTLLRCAYVAESRLLCE
jgi:hypothetical protein